MSRTETVIREKLYNVQGTTKLNLYDAGCSQQGTTFEFFGNISASPLGILRIQQVHVVYEPDSDIQYRFEDDEFHVQVFQAAKEEVLETYKKGFYYQGKEKKTYLLNCETASFVCETKFGSDLFHTGSDGMYADLAHMKQYYGMILRFYFSGDLFTFEELETRFLKLWKERKK